MKTEIQYKDSGIEWVKRIPSEWSHDKIVSLFTFPNDRVSDTDFEPLSVTYGGVKKQVDDAAKTDNGENRKLLKIGDIAFNGRSDRMGACGASDYEGSISVVYHVLRKKSPNVHIRYFHHLFRNRLFSQEFYRWGRGIHDDMWTTKIMEMKRIQVPIPPLETQKRIADFLDTKTKTIDELVSKKERLIELLKEKRAAIITRAVTKGLDPKAKLKPSGIEWVGDIPDTWDVVPTKELFVERKLPIETSATDYVLLGLTTKGVRPRDPNDGFGKHPTNYDTYQVVFPNDLLMCLFDYDVTPRTVGHVEQKGIVTGAYTRLVPKKGAITKYYYYFFLFLDQKKELLHLCTGLRNAIKSHVFWTLINPKPDEHEQDKIVCYLDIITTKIDGAITQIESQIEKLKEYRSSLIYSAVTGKIKI